MLVFLRTPAYNKDMKHLSINRNHNIKTPKQLERHFKGVSSYRRIEIIILIHKNPSITLDKISENLDANYKTVGEHVSRLTRAGLISRKQSGASAEYILTPYGKIFCNFIYDFMQE
jgi:predicted transcriptional regulator